MQTTYISRTYPTISQLEAPREFERRAAGFEDGIDFNQHDGLQIADAIRMRATIRSLRVPVSSVSATTTINQSIMKTNLAQNLDALLMQETSMRDIGPVSQRLPAEREDRCAK